ncbi:MAG: DedA family protein [Candidatus Rokuibacteriota bacterium]
MPTVEGFVEHFTYLGIFAVLLVASLGAPIPEEMPIVAAAVLAHQGLIRWWLALAVCVVGVLSGDLVLYWIGRHWGERVLGWRPVRLLLSPAREERLTAAYRRRAVRTIVAARHVMGLRAAAFLTAGIARVPVGTFVAADAGAAAVGVPLTFGLAYFFTDRLGEVLADVHRIERWLGLLAALAVVVFAIAAWRRYRRRLGVDEPNG